MVEAPGTAPGSARSPLRVSAPSSFDLAIVGRIIGESQMLGSKGPNPAAPRGGATIEAMIGGCAMSDMLKVSGCCLFLWSVFAPGAYAQSRYTIEKWPGDLKTLPCEAFVKIPNGGWGLAGTIVVRSSNEVLSGNSYVKGNAVADIIEQKCGDPLDKPR
jgi:hypothetical protein